MSRITINCEKLNHPNTGLYHYCANLSKALLRIQPPYHELKIYAPSQAVSIYPPGTSILSQHTWHKLYNPNNYACDLWHATNQEGSYFPVSASIKKIITIHDLNYFNDPSRSLSKRINFLKNLKKRILLSNHLICISAYTLQELQRHINILIPYTIIYNGCNIDCSVTEIPPAVNISSPFIFTIGTITNKKNFHVLPALLMGNNYNLVIAGDIHRPAYRQKIVDAARQLGVASRVIFTGGISEGEKYWYYKNCIAFAFPSLNEGFGLPVVEAMAFGKPLFLSKATALPEVGGEDAFYFDDFAPNNMAQLFASKLNYFYENKTALEQKLITRSKTFSWQQAAKQHWEIYNKVLNTI